MQGFTLRSGSVIGREHIRLWKNNQDGVATGHLSVRGEEYLYGTICDGCSEGESSEIGAKLLPKFLCLITARELSLGTTLEKLPEILFREAAGYLRTIAMHTLADDLNPDAMVTFIRDHLLCTVIGFTMDSERCVVYSAGDGLVIVQDLAYRIDQDNRPLYLAYHLVDRAYLQPGAKELPAGFITQEISLRGITHLALCSDGFTEEQMGSLWGHGSDVKLVRELKRLSLRENRFSDDCTVIVIERKGEAP